MSSKHPAGPRHSAPEVIHASFVGASVVQLTGGEDDPAGAEVEELAAATIEVTSERVAARVVGGGEWIWFHEEVEAVWHGSNAAWTILAVPGVPDFGVAVAEPDGPEFRAALRTAYPFEDSIFWSPDPIRRAKVDAGEPGPEPKRAEPAPGVYDLDPTTASTSRGPASEGAPEPLEAEPVRVQVSVAAESPIVEPLRAAPPVPAPKTSAPPTSAPPIPAVTEVEPPIGSDSWPQVVVDLTDGTGMAVLDTPTARVAVTPPTRAGVDAAGLAALEARTISAWFGSHHVLDRVTLTMHPGQVTALIGPSGCGKSTFLRVLNRMHEMIPGASLAGEVRLDGTDIYDAPRKLTDARRQIGMVFQKPNPFPAMSIYDNVVASFRLTGTKVSASDRDGIVESCLAKAGLWAEVRDRLRQPGGSLSGGQQQRLCIARALAIRPRVLLMDEPCSALDPTSTRRIEQTIMELRSEVTIVIVTHNMQQAARVSNQCAFFLAAAGSPGVIIEYGDTEAMFAAPQDERTLDYVNGRFG